LIEKQKIFERNPDTGVIRWRYVGEDPNDYGWPNYGNILDEEKKDNEVRRVRNGSGLSSPRV